MKLLVIGHSVFDTIEDDFGIKQSPGGIFYTISALNKIKSVEDEIFLCSAYDDETYHHFKSEFDKVNISSLKKIDKISRVNLKHLPGKERIEKYENLNQTGDGARSRAGAPASTAGRSARTARRSACTRRTPARGGAGSARP